MRKNSFHILNFLERLKTHFLERETHKEIFPQIENQNIKEKNLNLIKLEFDLFLYEEKKLKNFFE